MTQQSYEQRRSELELYFDKTAAAAWEKLTSNAPVGKIRATVRAGRNEMRQTLLSWLPDDLSGCRLLDAGCGTGAFSVEAARRGAEVTAIDLSETLVNLAKERTTTDLGQGSIDFKVGDLLDPTLSGFDYVVAMDSLIHYELEDKVKTLASLASRTSQSIVFTFAPKTPALTMMHAVGQFFPRGNRSPAIVPSAEKTMMHRLSHDSEFNGWRVGRTHRVSSGFYTSQAMELLK